MYFPSEKDDWENSQKNNVTIDLNVLYVKKEKMHPAYISTHNSNCQKQVILLIISNEPVCEATSKKQWHYLAVKKLSALLGGITSKNDGDFYCLNCLLSFKTKSKLESQKYVRIKIFLM